MTQNQIQNEPIPLTPKAREWLVRYARQLLMDLTEEERNEIIKEYE